MVRTSLSQAPASETLLYQLLGAVAWLLPAVWITGQSHFEPTLRVWAHLGFHSVVVSFASFLTWFWMLRRYLASPLGVLTFLTPLLGVLLGVQPDPFGAPEATNAKTFHAAGQVLCNKDIALVVLDGQRPIELAKGDEVEMRVSRQAVRFLENPDRPFLRTLQAKLGWQGSERRSL